MDLPYGFDCFAFQPNEVKYFSHDLKSSKSVGVIAKNFGLPSVQAHEGHFEPNTTHFIPGYVRFTRKDEYYPPDQLEALLRADRLDTSAADLFRAATSSKMKLFCGIKIQIGIGVIADFLHKGLQYRKPIKGRSELINGSWTGIVSGLTVDSTKSNSYDIAIGNFLAYDEEYPYMRFGPFFAVESKLVLLTGGSKRIESSSFGTNVRSEIWVLIIVFMLTLSFLATFKTYWHFPKSKTDEKSPEAGGQVDIEDSSITVRMVDFFFIYFTMLLNKPSVEFDDLIWPKHGSKVAHRRIVVSMRLLSYVWSASCLVMASIYSGELLAVILLHADQNIDTISQLINVQPEMEPVIRQDDFTYNLMLKSPDKNMLQLYNMTKFIPRTQVYDTSFIESVSSRRKALIGDDELIETVYDIYHKKYPLYISKITYLQYPISIIYRKDLNKSLEAKLRRGMVQMFEMGLTHRWYQAQKDTYKQFYESDSKGKTNVVDPANKVESAGEEFKPLALHHFKSLYKLMGVCIVFAFVVLFAECVQSGQLNIRHLFN